MGWRSKVLMLKYGKWWTQFQSFVWDAGFQFAGQLKYSVPVIGEFLNRNIHTQICSTCILIWLKEFDWYMQYKITIRLLIEHRYNLTINEWVNRSLHEKQSPYATKRTKSRFSFLPVLLIAWDLTKQQQQTPCSYNVFCRIISMTLLLKEESQYSATEILQVFFPLVSHEQ